MKKGNEKKNNFLEEARQRLKKISTRKKEYPKKESSAEEVDKVAEFEPAVS